MIKNICLLLAPSETSIFGFMGAKIFPLSIGIITSYLRENGYNIDQFDLHKNMSVSFNKDDVDKLEGFFDKEKVFSYLKGEKNDFFDEILKNNV